MVGVCVLMTQLLMVSATVILLRGCLLEMSAGVPAIFMASSVLNTTQHQTPTGADADRHVSIAAKKFIFLTLLMPNAKHSRPFAKDL